MCLVLSTTKLHSSISHRHLIMAPHSIMLHRTVHDNKSKLYNLKYLLLILLNLPTIKHSFTFLRIRARTIAISGAEFLFVRRAPETKST